MYEQLSLPFRVRYITPEPPKPPKRNWTRGTKIVFNQTTELNLRLNDIVSNRYDHVPEIVRLILMPYHHQDVTEDAVWLILDKVWASTTPLKVLA